MQNALIPETNLLCNIFVYLVLSELECTIDNVTLHGLGGKLQSFRQASFVPLGSAHQTALVFRIHSQIQFVLFALVPYGTKDNCNWQSSGGTNTIMVVATFLEVVAERWGKTSARWFLRVAVFGQVGWKWQREQGVKDNVQ